MINNRTQAPIDMWYLSQLNSWGKSLIYFIELIKIIEVQLSLTTLADGSG